MPPVSLAALEPKFWQRFCDAVGIEMDPTALFPGEHQSPIRQKLTELFRAKTAAQWQELSQEHDCCIAVALAPAELADDAQAQKRQWLMTQSIGAERVPQLRLPITAPDAEGAPSPLAGEHTRPILREAGLSEAEVDALLRSGAVRQAKPRTTSPSTPA